MDRRIRWLGLVFLACFGLLFLQLNNWQVAKATTLPSGPGAATPLPANAFKQQRGLILTSDFTVIAQSVKEKGHWIRWYAHGPLFADVTGYWDVTAEAAPFGLEGEYSNYLAEHETPVKLGSLLSQHEEPDDLVTTISEKLQAAAKQALAGRVGAVVAVDPRTGAVLAMYGNPTYDPNGLSGINAATANKYFKALDPDSGSSPLVNAATDDLHPPGSTFKIIDTAAVLDHKRSIAQTVWPAVSQITVPGTTSPGNPKGTTLHNYGFESCGGNLAEILAKSCDTAYALIGVQLGAPTVINEAEAFGFNKTPPLDLPADVAASQVPAATQLTYPGDLAITAIGQLDDNASALQMALISAGVSNGGVIMTPHLLDHVLNQQGQVVDNYVPKPWITATSTATAAQLRQLLTGPTSYGTLAGVLSPAEMGGITVGGKTGTAEVTTPSGTSECGYDWVTAFGPDGPGQTPDLAVAAWVSGAGAACDGTGATVAGPVVQAVMRAGFGLG